MTRAGVTLGWHEAISLLRRETSDPVRLYRTLRWFLALLLLVTDSSPPIGERPRAWIVPGAAFVAMVLANLWLPRLPAVVLRALPAQLAIAAFDVTCLTFGAAWGIPADSDLYLLYIAAVLVVAVAGRPSAVFAAAALALLAFTLSRGETAWPVQGHRLEFVARIAVFAVVAAFSASIADAMRGRESRAEEMEDFARELGRQVDSATRKLLDLVHYNESILDSVPVGVVVTDLTGTITTFNAEAEKLTALARTEALRTPLAGHPPLAPLEAVLRATLSEGRAAASADVEADVARMRRTWDVTATLLSTRERSVTGGVLVFRDVTELRAMDAKVRHMDRLAALGELSSMIAHEVRNPLNTIRGFARRLARKLSERDIGGTSAEDARFVVEEVDRLGRIVSELLDYARPGRRRLALVALRDLAQESLKMIKGRFQDRGVTYHLDFSADLPPAMADRGQMKQVFLNLLLNAVAAMRDGGHVIVSGKEVSGEEGAAPPVVEILVADTGPGIPHELHSRIFEPFFTTKTTGTGLGLAICKNIVEAHGGTIGVDSAVGVGTTFILRLPAASPGPASAAPPAPLERPAGAA